MQGRIVNWLDDRGFGFIERVDDQDCRKTFVHVSALPGGEPPPHLRVLVQYDVETTPKGLKAVNVSYVDVAPRADVPARYGDVA